MFTTHAAMASTDRIALAVRLRTQGLDYAEIARRCGYKSRHVARNTVARELRTVRVSQVDELRAVELLQMDALHQRMWPLALRGDYPAVDMVLRISAARRRLLHLDVTPGKDDPRAEVRIVSHPTAQAQENTDVPEVC